VTGSYETAFGDSCNHQPRSSSRPASRRKAPT